MSTTPATRATDHLEREVKLEAGLDLALPDLRPLVGTSTRQPERRLETAYFDTADMRLFDRGMSLRHRTGEGPPPGTWTLKLPEAAGPSALERRELSWPGGPDEVPEEARRLVAAVTRNATLQAVVELHTLRRPLELSDSAGRAWAELDDDTVTVRGGPRDGLRFREVEVELTEGGPGGGSVDGRPGGERPEPAGDLRGVLRALEEAGARRRKASKLATALGRDASPAARPEPGRRATLEAVVRHSLGSGLDRLLAQDVRIRLEPTRPPVAAVHQARVATRRLRSDLKTFRPTLDEVWVRHVRDELRVVGTALGRVRDLDVLDETLRAAGEPSADAAGLRELLARLAEQRRAAAEALAERMADPHYLRLLDRIDSAALSPPFRSGRAATGSRLSRRRPGPEDPARRVMPALVGVRWRSLRRRARKAGRRPTGGQLHRIRIRAKEVRYAAEAAAPVVGAPARRTAKAAARLQQVLGDHHDTVAAEAWLREEALRGGPWASFSAGQLTAGLRLRERALRREWRRHWRKLDRKATRRWLR